MEEGERRRLTEEISKLSAMISNHKSSGRTVNRAKRDYQSSHEINRNRYKWNHEKSTSDIYRVVKNMEKGVQRSSHSIPHLPQSSSQITLGSRNMRTFWSQDSKYSYKGGANYRTDLRKVHPRGNTQISANSNVYSLNRSNPMKRKNIDTSQNPKSYKREMIYKKNRVGRNDPQKVSHKPSGISSKPNASVRQTADYQGHNNVVQSPVVKENKTETINSCTSLSSGPSLKVNNPIKTEERKVVNKYSLISKSLFHNMPTSSGGLPSRHNKKDVMTVEQFNRQGSEGSHRPSHINKNTSFSKVRSRFTMRKKLPGITAEQQRPNRTPQRRQRLSSTSSNRTPQRRQSLSSTSSKGSMSQSFKGNIYQRRSKHSKINSKYYQRKNVKQSEHPSAGRSYVLQRRSSFGRSSGDLQTTKKISSPFKLKNVKDSPSSKVHKRQVCPGGSKNLSRLGNSFMSRRLEYIASHTPVLMRTRFQLIKQHSQGKKHPSMRNTPHIIKNAESSKFYRLLSVVAAHTPILHRSRYRLVKDRLSIKDRFKLSPFSRTGSLNTSGCSKLQQRDPVHKTRNKIIRKKKDANCKNKQIRKIVKLSGVRYARSGKSLQRLSAPSSSSPYKSPPSPVKMELLKQMKKLAVKHQSSATQKAASQVLHRYIIRSQTAKFRKSNKPEGSKKYCIFFNRFGRCKRGDKCPYAHDRDKVAVCTRFLKGKCKNTDGSCPFSHTVSKEKMPVCRYFLKGICIQPNCPYSHVKVSSEANICIDFVRGYCPLGDKCSKKHVLECAEYNQTGHCPRKGQCPLWHKRRNQKRKAHTEVENPKKQKTKFKPSGNNNVLSQEGSRTSLGDKADKRSSSVAELSSFIELTSDETEETSTEQSNFQSGSSKTENILQIRPLFSS